MSLRPPSTSPSPSPGPQQNSNPRASLQPQPRGTAAAAGLAPLTTRQNFTPGPRPTSELLGVGSAAFQNTPEAEAIDQWFENLQSYEATLEDMAAASLDLNFKEELSAIEQWFRVLSEAERTAALYSLLQHSTQVQIRFFITVLQQMARSDPMTALLSPAVGSSMQSQMEAKLASMGLKSPGLPSSPSIRSSFGVSTPPASSSRQSMDPSSYLSPESAQKSAAANAANASNEAAAALAHQRAKLKANNASHRLSAPGPILSENVRPTSLWTQSTLSQVAERAPSPATSDLSPAPSSNVRPKSTDFTGLANQFARSPNPSLNVQEDDGNGAELDINELRLNEQLSPMVGGNWASMVNTPLVPMFSEGSAIGSTNRGDALEAAASKLANWSMGGNGTSRVVLDDAKKFRRDSKGNPTGLSSSNGMSNNGSNLGNSPNSMTRSLGKEDGSNLVPPANKNAPRGNGSSSWRAGSRSPASSSVSSARFPAGSDAGSNAGGSNFGSVAGGGISPGMGLGMGMGNFPGMYNGMGMNGMPNMAGLANMGGMSPMQANALESQLMALNGAFSPSMGGGFPNPGAGMGMGGMGNFGMGMGMGMGMGVQGQPGGPASRSVRGGRGGAPGSDAGSRGFGGAAAGGRQFNKQARPAAKPKVQLKDEDINLTLLNDVPGWFHILRLHKYTPVVGNKTWKELVIMNDSELEKLGISALGARRKLLKHFVVVRNKFNIPHPEGAETGEASDDDEEGGGQGGDKDDN